jgi:DNA-binding NarL/FixJ family response regulator
MAFGLTIRPLSPHQVACLCGRARGLRLEAIATELAIAPSTVEAHLASARAKLGAANTTQAVAEAITQGLLCSAWPRVKIG